jgi:small multidrug resistance pump
MAYLQLFLAILAEVVGTSALKASEGFSRFLPSLIVVLAYGLSFFFLSLVLKVIPVGVAYAIWAGVGILLIVVSGILFFQEKPDLPAVIGMVLIVSGVAVIHIFSKTV